MYKPPLISDVSKEAEQDTEKWLMSVEQMVCDTMIDVPSAIVILSTVELEAVHAHKIDASVHGFTRAVIRVILQNIPVALQICILVPSSLATKFCVLFMGDRYGSIDQGSPVSSGGLCHYHNGGVEEQRPEVFFQRVELSNTTVYIILEAHIISTLLEMRGQAS
jgi:hypothetical protein